MPKLCKNKWIFWFVAYYHCIPISLILTLLGNVNCQVSNWKIFRALYAVWVVKKRTSKIISRVCKLSSMVCIGTHVSIFFEHLNIMLESEAKIWLTVYEISFRLWYCQRSFSTFFVSSTQILMDEGKLCSLWLPSRYKDNSDQITYWTSESI